MTNYANWAVKLCANLHKSRDLSPECVFGMFLYRRSERKHVEEETLPDQCVKKMMFPPLIM